MPKFVSIEEAVKLIPDGATVMFGGFMGCGNAHKFIDALAKSGVKDLTMISNDGACPIKNREGEVVDYYGVAKLIHNKQVKRLIATHVGLHKEVAHTRGTHMVHNRVIRLFSRLHIHGVGRLEVRACHGCGIVVVGDERAV